MKTEAQIFENIAESLGKLFMPMAEFAVFDNNNQLQCIFNRLTHENVPLIEPNQIQQLTINKNQLVNAKIIPLNNNYYLRILVDTSFFSSLQNFLQQFLGKHTEIPKIIHWQEQIDHFIKDHLSQKNTLLSALNSQQKRCLLLEIHEKGLLAYQDATNYLAKLLQVSRATIYNYLQQANQLKSLQIHQVDAFTDEPFSGNPAGVVLDAHQLNENMMKKITREMNLSETSFVFPSKKASIKLRYFTPTGSEVKFCGHSTVAALYMLAHKKMLGIEKPGEYKLTLEAKVGILPAAIHLMPDQSITIQFETPQIQLVNSPLSHQEISKALGIPIHYIDLNKPIMYEKINQDLYITISSLKNLGKLQVDQKTAKQFADKYDIVAYALLCKETMDKNNHIHMRCFAPSVGIPEDPFTGSVLGGLAAYLTKTQLIDKNLKMIRIEQGHFIERPGFVDLKLQPNNKPPIVIAKARHFFSTEINL